MSRPPLRMFFRLINSEEFFFRSEIDFSLMEKIGFRGYIRGAGRHFKVLIFVKLHRHRSVNKPYHPVAVVQKFFVCNFS